MDGLLQQQAPQAQPQPAGQRKATPQEQQAYNTLVKQVMGFMANPEIVDTLKQMTETQGPEKALAFVVGKALGLVGHAAQQAGASVAMHTGQAALREILTALASMLAAAGAVKDVKTTVETVMQMILGGANGPAN